MNRKLSFLSLLFVMLLGVGAYLWLFGKPTAPKENLLKSVDADKISKITIKNNATTTRLEKQNDLWNVLEPLPDVADPAVPPAIIATLKNFTLGSIISENPGRYSEFNVDPAHGAEVNVYVTGQDKPVFSGIIGKNSSGYDTCYFRFAVSSGPVYLASGLEQYQFTRDPTSFRWTSILGLPTSEDPTHIKAVGGKKTWELSRSSATWTLASGKVLDSGTMGSLLKSIRDFNADDFATGVEKPEDLGFDPPAAPAFVLTVDAHGTSHVVTVGKLAPKKFPQAPLMRYVRSSTRTAVMLVQDNIVTQLINSFANVTK